MDREEIITRLKRLADHAVHARGVEPYIMSLDDGLAIHAAIDMLSGNDCEDDCRTCNQYDREKHYCPRFCSIIRETIEDMTLPWETRDE